ncbi:hypothetical protein ACLMJK_006141 [Lecanora helva]
MGDQHGSPSSSTYSSIIDEKYECASNTSKGLVRICAHQTLSWDRFHQIVNLPNIKDVDHLEALTKQTKYHGLWEAIREGKAKMNPWLGTFPTGHYYLRSGKIGHCYISKETGIHFGSDASYYYVHPKTPGAAGDFVLSIHQTYQVTKGLLKLPHTKERMKRRLAESRIQFCEHMGIGDPWVLEISWKLLHPSDDPCERHVAEQNEKWCDHCQTVVHVHFGNQVIHEMFSCFIDRFLGEGKSPDDPSWVQQCESARTR